MKKVYNQPTINVVCLQPFRLMEGSQVPVAQTDYNPGTQTVGAKGGMFWSDDDFAYEDYEEE